MREWAAAVGSRTPLCLLPGLNVGNHRPDGRDYLFRVLDGGEVEVTDVRSHSWWRCAPASSFGEARRRQRARGAEESPHHSFRPTRGSSIHFENRYVSKTSDYNSVRQYTGSGACIGDYTYL